PGIGQQHAVTGALNQRQACELLQIADLQRDGGLREMQVFGGGGNRPVAVNGRERAQLANGQFPRKPACHGAAQYKKNFAKAKDKKISLILQTGLFLKGGAPNGVTRWVAPKRAPIGELPWTHA